MGVSFSRTSSDFMCLVALLVELLRTGLPFDEISLIFLEGSSVENAPPTPHNFGVRLDVEHGTAGNGRH